MSFYLGFVNFTKIWNWIVIFGESSEELHMQIQTDQLRPLILITGKYKSLQGNSRL